MQHRAIYCGKYAASLIKEYKTADVLGVYSAGTYLLFGESIVLICDAEKKSVPFGISIEDYPAFRDSVNGAETAYINNGTLTLGGGSVKADGIGEDAVCLIPAPPKREALEYAKKLLLQKKDTGFCRILAEGEPKDAYAKRAKHLTEELFEALNGGEGTKLDIAVSGLVGLGGGLTPSGDDLICGALYALHYCEGTQDKALELARAARAAQKNTNIISRRYLTAAAEGEYFGLVADLINALCGDGDIEKALDSLLTVGSSSGGDIAAGILLAYN
ncbi:MAG: DUF2877 domain-containing protein [Clostridia bacterium]|nr:DUF2877 domain-containing protein [Clostridia bacterium]